MARLKNTKPPVELETLEVELEEEKVEEVEEVEEVEVKPTPPTPNGLPLQQETFLSHYNPQ
jgi:hypothetical protein